MAAQTQGRVGLWHSEPIVPAKMGILHAIVPVINAEFHSQTYTVQGMKNTTLSEEISEINNVCTAA